MPTTNPKILLTLTCDDFAALHQLAIERAEPGQPPNRSEAVRFLLREYRGRTATAARTRTAKGQ
jgi:hypothetical protein